MELETEFLIGISGIGKKPKNKRIKALLPSKKKSPEMKQPKKKILFRFLPQMKQIKFFNRNFQQQKAISND